MLFCMKMVIHITIVLVSESILNNKYRKFLHNISKTCLHLNRIWHNSEDFNWHLKLMLFKQVHVGTENSLYMNAEFKVI